MDEKPDEIMNHIESQRNQLGRNLDELEARVKRTADWRAQFDRNPMLMMGVALGGGMLLGSIVSGTRRSAHPSWSSSSKSYSGSSIGRSSSYSAGSTGSASGLGSSAGASSTSPTVREAKGKVTDTLEQIKTALIAFGTAKMKDFMSEALPGFGQHMEQAERQHRASYGGSQEYSGQFGGGSYGSGAAGSEFQRPTSWQSGVSQSGGSGMGSQGSGTGAQNQGNPRTEYSSQTPYNQEPAGVNTGRNT